MSSHDSTDTATTATTTPTDSHRVNRQSTANDNRIRWRWDEVGATLVVSAAFATLAVIFVNGLIQ